MGNRLRRLGVYGQTLPTKKSLTVTPSDFLIGGIIGKFARQYKAPMLCRNIEEFQTMFGLHETSGWYGWDVVKGFFDNIVGVSGKLYVKSHVGSTALAVFDGVTATASPVDGTPVACMRIDHAYENTLCFGAAGNSIGYTITRGYRFSTTTNGVGVNTDTWVIVDSTAGIFVGDTIMVIGAATFYRVVTAVDELLKKVSFVGATGEALADEKVVNVLGFRLRLWKRDATGIVNEVDADLGKVYCTIGNTVNDYWVSNVFSTSKYVKVTDLDAAAATPDLAFPAAVATVTYLAAGADGSGTVTTKAHWDSDLAAFDNIDVRFLCNAECTQQDINEAGELYCKSRWDNPKWLYNIPSDRSKAQLITIGNNYQKSTDVIGTIVATWLKVTDPFATSALAPYRNIPNVGHVMGAWIRSIANNGIHFIPAIATNPLYGIQGLVGDTLLSDDDRTDVAEAGVNVIQDISGSGYIIRNFFTPSTTTEFMFGNGILMRSYIMVSVKDSIANTENEPNNFARIKASKMAILKFFYDLWETGSTGSVPEGETFGQSMDAAGVATKPEEHFQVQADLVNNPQASINAGERNLDSWFTFPSPAGSIRIGVGFILR